MMNVLSSLHAYVNVFLNSRNMLTELYNYSLFFFVLTFLIMQVGKN